MNVDHAPHEPTIRRTATYPVAPEALPAGVLSSGRYQLRFARDPDDLDALLRLRFDVFNRELGEGLDESWVTGRDEDPLDATFHHLVIDHAADGVVGTYRLQTESMADTNGGYYSAGEFDLDYLPPAVRRDGVEIGRACVARNHRNGRVLQLLWRGLATYLAWNRKRYLFGCCSLTSQDAALGQYTWASLKRQGAAWDGPEVPPLPTCRCDGPEPVLPPGEQAHIPTLFQSYLRLGAKVCGPPAIDRAFKTIDFLVVLDTQSLDARTRRTFFR